MLTDTDIICLGRLRDAIRAQYQLWQPFGGLTRREATRLVFARWLYLTGRLTS